MTPEAESAAPVAKAAVQHVAVTGLSWGAIFTLIGVIVNVVIGGALVQWIKARPKMRELEQTAEDRFIKTLSERVGKLEAELKEERLRHEGAETLLRHRANNSDQCLDALLLLLESIDELPAPVRRAVVAVKEMRARQRQEEALEKGAMSGAKLNQMAEPVA